MDKNLADEHNMLKLGGGRNVSSFYSLSCSAPELNADFQRKQESSFPTVSQLAAYFSEPKNIEYFAGSQIRQFFCFSVNVFFLEVNIVNEESYPGYFRHTAFGLTHFHPYNS